MRRLIALVGAIIVLDTAFYAAITPLLPTYVETLGLTKGEAGLLNGAYPFGTLVAALPAGLVAARLGARTTLVVSLALLAGSSLAFGLADGYGLLVAARLGQGVGGAGSWAAGLVWLVASVPRERRGETIGTVLGLGIAGAVGGPVLGSLAEALSPELVFSAVAAAALGLLGGVLLAPAAAPDPAGRGLGAAARDRRALVGFWLVLLPALFYGILGVLVPLRLDELGAGSAVIGLTFLVAAACEAAMSPLAGRLSDRHGRRAPLRAGLAGMIVAAILLPLPAAAWLLVGCVCIAAIVTGLLWAPATALLSDRAEAVGMAQGLAFGLLNLAWAGGQTLGSAGGAGLAEATADAVPYAFVAVAALFTWGLLRVPSRSIHLDRGRNDA